LIIIVSPIFVTGGVESLHQLANLLTLLNIENRIAYVSEGFGFNIDNDDFIVNAPDKSISEYGVYRSKMAESCKVSDIKQIIFPEVFTNFARQLCHHISTAIWWLSVDNAFTVDSPLLQEQTRKEFFQLPIQHYYQSRYAANFLQQHGVRDIYEISDYLDYERFKKLNLKKKITILYNPRKGKERALALAAQMPHIKFIPLTDMTSSKVQETMQKSRLYMDFGHHPGKDRMPREAANQGCVVMCRTAGAAQFFEDVPLPQHLMFNDFDLLQGNLAQRVQSILTDGFEDAWKSMDRYRNLLDSEPKLMLQKVQTVFK
jgi:hypothetical protein